MEELIAYLHSIYPIPPALWEHLRKIIRCRTLKKKEYLLRAGEVCRNMYFVQSGLLRCYSTKKNGMEITGWIFKEGRVVTAVHSFYDQKEGFENIHALEDTIVFYISHAELEEIYLAYLEFNYIGRLLTIDYVKFWSDRFNNFMMHTAEERFQFLMASEDSDLFNRVPQKYLASYLDMLPETLSRKRNR